MYQGYRRSQKKTTKCFVLSTIKPLEAHTHAYTHTHTHTHTYAHTHTHKHTHTHTHKHTNTYKPAVGQGTKPHVLVEAVRMT